MNICRYLYNDYRIQMEKEGKKYIIKESELKDIIREMILMEWTAAPENRVNPANFKANLMNGQLPSGGAQPKEVLTSLSNILRGAPNALIPDNWKEKVESGDSGFLKWLMGVLGARTNPNAKGPDSVPNLGSGKWFGGPGLGKGNNSDAHEVFYPMAAAQYLRAHATPRYIKGQNGHCARNVREALNEGGLTCPWGMFRLSGSAKGYIKILFSNGWAQINSSEAGQVGDIIVLDAFRGHPDGHVAMCCGNGQWVSDFVQGDMYGINGKVPPEVVHIFRYTNIAQ